MKLEEIYTIEDRRDRSWATWLATAEEGNTYTLSLLCSRENSERESYKAVAHVAFLSDDSAKLTVFHDVVSQTKIEAAYFLPHVLMAHGIKVRGYEVGSGILPDDFELLPATRCKRCARLLTRPLSIRTRIGDECANRKPRAGSKYARAKAIGSPEEMLGMIRANRMAREAAKPFKLPTK